MKKLLKRLNQTFLRTLLSIPFIKSYSNIWFSKLGVKGIKYRISPDIKVIGDYKNIELARNVEINAGCYLLAKEKIKIGENTTLAYQTTILTSADPNSPHNLLYKIYGSIIEPVIIGENCWIGARSVILPGITIGDCCVVGAGSVVTKDVPNYRVVAGVPACVKKILNKNILLSNN